MHELDGHYSSVMNAYVAGTSACGKTVAMLHLAFTNKGLPPIKIFKAQRRHSTVLERGTRSSITLRRL